VGELKLLLQNVTLQVDKDDKWLWNVEASHVFSVRSAYNLITAQQPTASSVAAFVIWNRDVPQKVGLFAWRLFRDRLSTKDNLLMRGVITNESRLCVVACDSEKNTAHLCLHCPFFGSVWYHIYRWLGISTASPLRVGGHFNQFIFVGGVSKARRSILHVIWFASVWEIWKERNNRQFKGKECTVV